MKHLSPAQQRTGFRIHAIVFVCSMVLVAIINVLTGPPYWALWVLLGWGIGILSHGATIWFQRAADARTG